MDTAFNSIDEVCDLNIFKYHLSSDGEHHFYFSELSSLQVLREMNLETSLQVTKIFSQRHRIAQKTDAILATKTVDEFLNIVIPLVEGGCFPCDDLSIVLNKEIYLSSHDDGEVHLTSKQTNRLWDLVKKILVRQGFSIDTLGIITNYPNLYLKLEPPNNILAKYKTFDEVIENL